MAPSLIPRVALYCVTSALLGRTLPQQRKIDYMKKYFSIWAHMEVSKATQSHKPSGLMNR